MLVIPASDDIAGRPAEKDDEFEEAGLPDGDKWYIVGRRLRVDYVRVFEKE